ncbi:MAG: 50S ribosomal protein L4 [Candidatus Kerfeldbacteria bacterium]|nr:50S ribosomal protein L4 [Candidatus Kerfeldbacteria bacterium]
MPIVPMYNQAGQQVGSHDLPDRIFGLTVKPELVAQAVLTQQANARTAIAHTKTRGEVRGGGKKPWRQKGTGRARHGSIRSPLWKGGGVTFGPRNTRNFSLKMNKKARQKALYMALSDKVAANRLIVIDSLELPAIKTKAFIAVMKKLPLQPSTLVILPAADERLVKSCRNIPNVTTIRGDSLNVVDVMKHESILLPRPAVEVIDKTYRTVTNR